MKKILAMILTVALIFGIAEPMSVNATVNPDLSDIETILPEEPIVPEEPITPEEPIVPEEPVTPEEPVEEKLELVSFSQLGVYQMLCDCYNVDSVVKIAFAESDTEGNWYTIEVLEEGLVLEADAAGNVQLAAFDGAENQLWRFADAKDKSYYIESALDGFLNCEDSALKISAFDKETTHKWKITDAVEMLDGVLYVGGNKANGKVEYKGFSVSYKDGLQIRETVSADGLEDKINSFEDKFADPENSLTPGEKPNKDADNDGVLYGADGKPITFKDYDTSKVYVLKKYTNGSRCISAKDAGTSAGTVFNLEGRSYTEKEQFVLEKTADGWYLIKNVLSGKVLQVVNDSASGHANVQMADKNNSDAQLWQFVDAGEDSCYIRSKSGMALESAWGSDGLDTKIWMSEMKYSQSQRWVLEEAAGTAVKSYEDGTYLFSAYGDDKKFISLAEYSKEDGIKVALQINHYDNAESFSVETVGEGWFKLTNNLTGKVLSLESASDNIGVFVQQDTYDGSFAQQWRFVEARDGYLMIQSRMGTVLERKGASIASGTKVVSAEMKGTDSQLWKVQSPKAPALAQNVKDGHKYIIAAKKNKDLVFNVMRESLSSNAKISLKKDSLSRNQSFEFVQVEDSWFKIKTVQSDQFLTLASAEFADDVQVVLNGWKDDDTQLFRFIRVDNSTCYIQSKIGTYLTYNSSECSEGDVIVAKTFTEKDNQKFALYDTSADNVIKVITISETESKLVIYNPTGLTDGVVKAAVWSMKDGQDDLRWLELTKADNYWYVDICSSSFYAVGDYTAHVYAVNSDTSIILNGTTFRIEKYPVGWTYIDGYRRYMQEDGTIMKDVSSIFKPSSYYITIDRIKGITTVYGYNSATNSYDTPVTAFWCSVGNPISLTPYGYHKSDWKMKWKEMNASDGSYRCWASYVTEIKGAVYFHGVASNTPALDTVSRYAFNALGTPQSHGCVRLAACDAKWIYVNCPLGTQIRVGDNLDSPISQPTRYTWTGGSVGSDPTWTPL